MGNMGKTSNIDKDDKDSVFIGTGEAARLLGIAPRTVRNQALRHNLARQHWKGGHLRYRLSEVIALKERWDSEGKKATPSKSPSLGTKKPVDRLIDKAQEEHLAEIRSLLEKWLSLLEIKTVSQLRTYGMDVQPGNCSFFKDWFAIHDMLADPLFKFSFKSHIQFDELWDNFSQWVPALDEYVNAGDNLWISLQKVEEEAYDWPDVHHVYVNSFKVPILNLIGLGQKAGRIPTTVKHDFTYSVVADDEGNETDMHELGVREFGILVTSDVTSSSRKYQEVTIQLINSEASLKVIEMYTLLTNITNKLKEAIQKSLLGRMYVKHTCSICPYN